MEGHLEFGNKGTSGNDSNPEDKVAIRYFRVMRFDLG